VLDQLTGGGSAFEADRTRRRQGGGVSVVLAAAMLAVGEALEPHKTEVQIAAEAAPEDGLPFDLDFGDLPPI
jgi:hypothetical protein